MTNPLTIKDTHPAKDFTGITQAGLKAYNLAVLYKAEIEARLPGTTDALSADLVAFGVVVPGAVQARHESRVATTTQNTVLKQGYERVRAIRQTVRKAGAKKDVQRAYGVGQATSPNMVRHVQAALQQIVDRATGAPDEAAGFGLTATAVAELNTFVSALTDADMTQEKKRAHAPLSTKQRNVTANRILQTTVLIAGAGMLAFADNPLTLANFKALMASTNKTRPLKAAKQPDAPEVPKSPPNADPAATAGPASA
jgi:hypothetical protein